MPRSHAARHSRGPRLAWVPNRLSGSLWSASASDLPSALAATVMPLLRQLVGVRIVHGIQRRGIAFSNSDDGLTVAARPAGEPMDPGSVLKDAGGDEIRGLTLRASDLFTHRPGIGLSKLTHQCRGAEIASRRVNVRRQTSRVSHQGDAF
jgi:hypothetical protein